MTVEKPKPKQLLRPITTGAESAMNQSESLAITCNSLEAREKSRVHGTIGFCFDYHLLKNWRESFKPITLTTRQYCFKMLLIWTTSSLSHLTATWPLFNFCFQVLVSIQGMMFTPDPCFNEPGYEGIRGTDEGDVSDNRVLIGSLSNHVDDGDNITPQICILTMKNSSFARLARAVFIFVHFAAVFVLVTIRNGLFSVMWTT